MKSLKNYVQEAVLAVITVIFRSLSLGDLVTDVRLLYLSSQAELLLLTVSLFVTILLPYLLSYSVGIRIKFIRGGADTQVEKNLGVTQNDSNNDVIKKQNGSSGGFKILLNYLFIMPSGIIYYIFLDFLDLFFTFYKTIRIVVFFDNEQRLILLQETIAQQYGIGDRMNYEGLKRQKSISTNCYTMFPNCLVKKEK